MKKAIFAWMMALMLILGMMPAGALAASGTISSAKLSTKTLELGKSVKLTYKLKTKGNVTVQITNSKGKLAYKKTIKSVPANKARTLTWAGKASKGNGMGLKTDQLVPAGKYKVKVISGKSSMTLSLTVKAKPVKVKKIALNKKTLKLEVGEKGTLKVTFTPSNATNKKVTWKSSDTKVATVSAKGVVTANKAGQAKITVISDDGKKTATATVTVTEAAPPAPVNDPKVVGSWSITRTGRFIAVLINAQRQTIHMTFESDGTYRARNHIEINMGGSLGYYDYCNDISSGTYLASASRMTLIGGEFEGTYFYAVSDNALALGDLTLRKTDTEVSQDRDARSERTTTVTFPSTTTPGVPGERSNEATLGNLHVLFGYDGGKMFYYDESLVRSGMYGYTLRTEITGGTTGRSIFNNTNQPMTAAWKQGNTWVEWTNCSPCPDSESVLWLNFFTDKKVAETGVIRFTWQNYIIYYDIETNTVSRTEP